MGRFSLDSFWRLKIVFVATGSIRSGKNNCFRGERALSVATEIFEAGFVPASGTTKYEGDGKQGGTKTGVLLLIRIFPIVL